MDAETFEREHYDMLVRKHEESQYKTLVAEQLITELMTERPLNLAKISIWLNRHEDAFQDILETYRIRGAASCIEFNALLLYYLLEDFCSSIDELLVQAKQKLDVYHKIKNAPQLLYIWGEQNKVFMRDLLIGYMSRHEDFIHRESKPYLILHRFHSCNIEIPVSDLHLLRRFTNIYLGRYLGYVPDADSEPIEHVLEKLGIEIDDNGIIYA